MTVLSDRALTELGAVYPLGPTSIQPASIDVTLGEELEIALSGIVDPERPDLIRSKPASQTLGYWLLSILTLGLSTTAESVAVPPGHVGLLTVTSTLARLGVWVAPGLLDPGYYGRPSIDIISLVGPLRLRPGMVIGQVLFLELSGIPDRLYDGRYQGDTRPTLARLPGPRPARGGQGALSPLIPALGTAR